MIPPSVDQHPFVKLAGTGSYLPGESIPMEDIGRYLGDMPDAPQKVRRWLERIQPLMKEMLDIEYYHFAIDPVTRQFTEDNITMSVKAAKKALEDARMDAGDIDLLGHITGLGDYDAMTANAVSLVMFGCSVLVMDLADVIKSKRAAGRLKDKAVLPVLEETLRFRGIGKPQ